MASLSTGIATSYIYIYYPDKTLGTYNNIVTYENRMLSFPIELKMFVHAKNGIGVGFHFSKNLYSTKSEYSPFILAFSIVFGFWNNVK